MRNVDGLFDRYMRATLFPGRRLSDVKPPTLIDDARIYAAITNQVESRISDYRSSFLPD